MIDSFEESNKNGTDPYRLIKTSNRSKLYRIMRQGIPARTPGRCLTIESCDIFNGKKNIPFFKEINNL